jgi:hypothetical protein
VEVEFEKLTPDTMASLLVAYSPTPLHFVAAGLGLDINTMYAVTEMRAATSTSEPYLSYPGVGGDRSGLKAKEKYQLTAQFRGNFVVLRVDGVEVITCYVSPPQRRIRQVGLLCRGDHKITFRHFKRETQKPKVFVIMEFSADYDDVYNDVIKGVKDEYDLLRADDIHGPGLIIADIERSIFESQLIIADITAPNLNVFFEVGFAMALRKPIIFLARKGTPLPFDIAGQRVLFYENTIGGKGRLEAGLKRHLEAYMGTPD